MDRPDYLIDVFKTAGEMVVVQLSDLEERIDDHMVLIGQLQNIVEQLLIERKNDKSESLMLNVTEVAKIVGISRPTVYKLIQSGALPARKFASSEDADPRIVVMREDLLAFVANLPVLKPRDNALLAVGV